MKDQTTRHKTQPIVLLVEDDLVLARHWQQALEAQQFRVLHADSASHAIDIINKKSPHVVITDILVKDLEGKVTMLGGVLILSHIALLTEQSPKVLAITGMSTDSSFFASFKLLENTNAVRKPVTADEVVEKVSALAAQFEQEKEQEREKQRIQQELVHISESNRAMLDLLGASDGVWDWHVGTDDITFAPGWRKMLGYDGDDVTNVPNSWKALIASIHKQDQQAFQSCIAEHINPTSRAEKTRHFFHEVRIQHQDKSFVWLRFRGVVSFDPQGNATRAVGSAHDITQQKQAELERDRFFRSSTDLFGSFHLFQHKWLKISKGLSDLVRIPEAQVYKRTSPQLLHPDDRGVFANALEELKAGKSIRGLSTRIRSLKQNDYRWLEWYAQPPQEGEALAYLTARDTTELEVSFLSRLGKLLPLGLVVVDVQENQTLYHNGYLEQYTSQNTEQIWEGWRDIMPEDDVSRWLQTIETLRTLPDQQSVEYEFTMYSAEGEPHHFVGSYSPFKRSAEGNVHQVIGIIVRLDELEALKQYARRLEATNQSLEQFTYVASHDLKQPLRGIQTLAEWIWEDTQDLLPDESKQHLNKLLTSVQRMTKLLTELLHYAKAGQTNTPPTTFNLHDTIADIINLLSPQMGFVITNNTPSVPITTSQTEFEQVLRNLIHNAIKHHDKENGHIEVNAMIDKRTNTLEFDVQDNGPGIHPKFHKRIFEMFQTLTPRHKTESTGIGLTLVQRLILLQGGSISLTSAPGEGTTFQCTWPLRA
ncbi:MAG TPA: hypothetical protein DCE42_05535 [Myxococcales bacterium]|nr:hypothetical protein [Myxococcales bacterium]